MIPYGFHRQHGIVFLHEQAGGRCVSPGLGAMPSPFTVQHPHWYPCPHLYGPSDAGPAIANHPFVQAMGPDQAAGLFYVRPEHERWLLRLTDMIPSTVVPVIPYWSLREPRMRRVQPRLTITNAAPLVITDWSPRELQEIERLTQLPRTRNLVLCGPLRLPGSTLLEPEGLPDIHDWVLEGRRQLHRFIRKDA